MKQIRSKIFETNSSSTHSVIIDTKSDYINISKELIEVNTGEYGWEEETYYDFYDRANYALTYAANYGTVEDIELMKKVIEEHTGATVRLHMDLDQYGSSGYIDHQSVDEAATIFASEQTIKDFLFRESSYFETDNDNH